MSERIVVGENYFPPGFPVQGRYRVLASGWNPSYASIIPNLCIAGYDALKSGVPGWHGQCVVVRHPFNGQQRVIAPAHLVRGDAWKSDPEGSAQMQTKIFNPYSGKVFISDKNTHWKPDCAVMATNELSENPLLVGSRPIKKGDLLEMDIIKFNGADFDITGGTCEVTQTGVDRTGKPSKTRGFFEVGPIMGADGLMSIGVGASGSVFIDQTGAAVGFLHGAIFNQSEPLLGFPVREIF